jgi:hypothetical protein
MLSIQDKMYDTILVFSWTYLEGIWLAGIYW